MNSYRDLSESQYYGVSATSQETQLCEGFTTVYKSKSGGWRFSDLLEKVSQVDPEMRIRFTAPHPKDFPDEVQVFFTITTTYCKSLFKRHSFSLSFTKPGKGASTPNKKSIDNYLEFGGAARIWG